MSRAAVYSALTTDAELLGLGIGEDNVHPNYTLDTPPNRVDPFLILRWEEASPKGIRNRHPRILTVWAHIPIQSSEDHADLDPILARVEEVLTAMEQVDGGDGYIVTSINATGAGGDLKDVGYDTIVRNAAFEVLSRRA